MSGLDRHPQTAEDLMSHPASGDGATRAATPPPDPSNASTAQLLGNLSDHTVKARASR